MDANQTAKIDSKLELSGNHGAATAQALSCVIHVGMTGQFYDHLGDVRADVMQPGNVPHSQCWLAEDAWVGDVKVASVSGQSPEYVNWLNKNLARADLEITVRDSNVQWAARFPDGREFTATESFEKLYALFGRPTLADGLKAVGIVSGYPRDGKFGELYKTDSRFAQAFDLLCPNYQPSDWAAARVSDVLDLAKQTDERFALSKRDTAFAVLLHFGEDAPLVATYKVDPRFADAVNVISPTFETSFWHAEDTVGGFIRYIDRKGAAPAVARSGPSM